MTSPLPPTREGDGSIPIKAPTTTLPNDQRAYVIGGRRAPVGGSLTTTEWLNLVRSRIINSTAAPAEARQLPCAADRSPIPFIYGDDRIAGMVMNVLPVDYSGVPYVLAQVLWAHECDSISDIYYNDKPLPADFTHLGYGGTQTTPNSSLVSAFAAQGISYADALTGFSYSVFVFPASKFTGTANFTARLYGRKLHEPQFNAVKNYMMRNAVIGGSSGDNNSFNGFVAGGQYAITGIGVEDGIDYLDFRMWGTASGGASSVFVGFNWYGLSQMYSDANTVPGQQWSGGAFIKRVAGAMPGGCQVAIGVQCLNSSGTYIGGAVGYAGPAGSINPPTLPLRQCSYATGYGALIASSAGIGLTVGLSIPNGTVIDITIRIGLPRMWHDSWGDPFRASTNPSACAADFLANENYGCGKKVYWPSVATCAAKNDEMISSEKRRMLGVSFISSQFAKNVAETLRAYASVFYVPSADGIKFVPDAPRSTDATYSHTSGEIANITVQKKDMGNVPTVVEIVYTNKDQIPWRDASALAQASGIDVTVPRRLSQVALPGVARHSQANREAIERLNKLRTSDLSVVVDVFDKGIRHEEGDVIEVTHPLGLASKKLRVGDVDIIGNNLWRLNCAEYDPAAYSDAVVTVPTYPDTGYTNPLTPPATPTDFARTFTQSGIVLTWTRSPQLSVAEYELRQGGSWAGGAPMVGTTPTIVSGTSFLWPAQPAGSYTIRLKARTTFAIESATEATVTVTIAAPTLATMNASVEGANVAIVWTLASTDLPIQFYRVRKAGVIVAEVNSTQYTAPVDWAGDKTFSVAAVDVGGNEGAAISDTVSVSAVGAVASFIASVVVNTVLFYWQPPTVHALPIVAYRMRRGGTTWGTATPIGEKAGDQTFTTYFEGSEGTYKYWIAAVDSAGNEGTPASIDVEVDAPPGFRLQSEWNTIAGTLTNMVTWDGAVYAPVNATETFQQHFVNNSWTTPQAQVSAGFDPYLEPAQSTSSYVQTFDATGAAIDLTSSLITLAYSGTVIDGSPTITPKIEVATNAAPTTWTDLGNVWQAFASGFRYIRITLTVAASGSDDLLCISNVNLKLALKTETDAGSKTSGQFTGSPSRCTVAFTKDFIDVDSIVVTPKGTAYRVAVVDFTDAPNPSSFDVYIYNSAGTNTPTDFSWSAVGAV